jgi:hypothetical protein
MMGRSHHYRIYVRILQQGPVIGTGNPAIPFHKVCQGGLIGSGGRY